MRILIALMLTALISGCCISSDTKILARKIATSTKTQEIDLGLKLGSDQSPQAVRIRKRAAKLSEVTAGLADLLGAPKETE